MVGIVGGIGDGIIGGIVERVGIIIEGIGIIIKGIGVIERVATFPSTELQHLALFAAVWKVCRAGGGFAGFGGLRGLRGFRRWVLEYGSAN